MIIIAWIVAMLMGLIFGVLAESYLEEDKVVAGTVFCIWCAILFIMIGYKLAIAISC